MSIKVKGILKTILIIVSLPFVAIIFNNIINFIMQLGRIFGTLIRIIMEL